METIFTKLIEIELAAVCICAVIFILRLLMKKLPAKYSYCLWAILLIRLVVPFSVSSAVSMFNLIPDLSGIYVSDTAEQAAPQAQSETEGTPAPAAVYDPQYGIYTQSAVHNDTVPAVTAPAVHHDAKHASWKTILSLIWLACIAAIAVYSTVNMIKLKKLLRGAVKRDDVMVCDSIDTPFVFGLLHPRIYVPAGISDSELPYIIAHERVHIHRGDHIIKPLAFAVLALHWFDPVLWAAFRLMENDMERSCDEEAIAHFDTDVRKDYARALLGISSGSSMRGARLVSFGNSSVKSRIKNILSRKHRGLIATVTAFAILGASSVCMLTGASKPLSLDGITQGMVGFSQITPSAPMGNEYTAYSPIDTDKLRDILKSARRTKKPALPESRPQYNIELLNGTETEMILHIPLTDNGRTIIAEKMIWGSSTKEERERAAGYYTLSGKDFDRLMKLVTQSDVPFPAGHYTGTDEHYEAIVTEKGDTKQIEIIMDMMPLTVLTVPQNYGLEMTNPQGMETAHYQSYGVFTVTSAPISSLMIPCEFVYDERQHENVEYTTHNDLYDKAEKQMLAIVKQLISDKNFFLKDGEKTLFTDEDINYDFYNDWLAGTFTAAVYTSESDKIFMSFRFSDSGQLEYLGTVSGPGSETALNNAFVFTDGEQEDVTAEADTTHLISHGTFRIDEVTEP